MGVSFYNMEGAPFRYLRSVTTADSSGREQSRLPPSSARHRSGHVAAGLGPSGPRGPMRTSSGLAAGPRPTAQHQRVLLQTVATGGKRHPDGSTVLARALNLAPSTASKQADGLLCRQLCFDLTLRLHCSRAARATRRPGLSASAASDSPAASAAQADEGEEKEEEESPVGEQSGSPSGLAGLPVDQAALWAGERGPLWPGLPPSKYRCAFRCLQVAGSEPVWGAGGLWQPLPASNAELAVMMPVDPKEDSALEDGMGSEPHPGT